MFLFARYLTISYYLSLVLVRLQTDNVYTKRTLEYDDLTSSDFLTVSLLAVSREVVDWPTLDEEIYVGMTLISHCLF